MEARVTANSQTHRLTERLEEAGVRHGQEIRADLPGIRVTAARSWLGSRQSERGEVFFCSMGPIRLRSVMTKGDGTALPAETLVQGLNVAAEGTYDLVNALVQSNGDLRVVVDEATEVVRTDGRGGLRDRVPIPGLSSPVET